MKRNRIEHIFNIDSPRFWEIFFFDKRYFDGLYEYLELDVANVDLQQSGEGDTLKVTRRVRMSPRKEMPKLMKKVLKGASTVTEETNFDAARGRLDVNVTLPVISNRLNYGGFYTWQDLDTDRFKRVWEGHCDARIPLIGGKLESFLLGEIERDQKRVFTFTQDYLSKL